MQKTPKKDALLEPDSDSDDHSSNSKKIKTGMQFMCIVHHKKRVVCNSSFATLYGMVLACESRHNVHNGIYGCHIKPIVSPIAGLKSKFL